MLAPWLVWGGLLACRERIEKEAPPTCDNEILSEFPAAGDADVFYGTAVRFTLTEEDADAVITVEGPDGEVQGATTVTGSSVSWGGDPLTPLTDYKATLSYTCGDYSTSWSTSETGPPIAFDPKDRVYSLRIAEGEWVFPAGVGDIIATQVENSELLVVARHLDGEELTLSAAFTEGTQEPCVPTTPFTSFGWTDPFFETESVDPLYLVLNGTVHAIEEPRLSGAFSADGSRLEGATLVGQLHTEGLAPAFNLGGPDEVCNLVSGFGDTCRACPDGSGDTCLSIWLENLQGDYVTGGILTDRTQPEIDTDPSCAVP